MSRRCLPLFLLCVLLSGCWDRAEIEERTQVVAISLDGHESGYLVSIQVPIPLQIAGSGEGSGGENPVTQLSSTGSTPVEAMNNLQKRLNQRLLIGQTKVIAISDELARRNLSTLLDGWRRDPNVRRLMWPIIIEGQAASLMDFRPEQEQVPAFYIADMLRHLIDIGHLPELTLGSYYIAESNSTLEPMLYSMKVSEDQDPRMDRLAIFREGKMVGYLADRELIPVTHIYSGKPGRPMTVSLPEKLGEGHITYFAKAARTRIQVSEQGGRPRFDIYIRLEGDIMELTQSQISLHGPDTIRLLEQALKKEYTALAEHTMHKLQKELRTDVLRLGTHYRAKFPKQWEKGKRWLERFPEAQVQIHYDINIRRLGVTSRSF